MNYIGQSYSFLHPAAKERTIFMKDYLQLIAVFAVLLLLIPCVGYARRESEKAAAGGSQGYETVKILCEETGRVAEYSMKDYIIGAVFAQMPADFEDEALKAQAVLASTYARRRILAESAEPAADLRGAHMSDDGSRYQAFFTEDQAREVYGDGYGAALKKITAAAEYAEPLTLSWQGEPILVAFHGISYGKTESAQVMWGEEIPYLTSVDSEWDAELEECETVRNYSEAEMKRLLTAEFTDCDLSGEPEGWLTAAERSPGGTVLKMRAGGEICEASRICALLDLPSQHIEVEYADGEFTCRALGCGHLVGMSQHGANEMAKQGSGCEEILLHYFTGCEMMRK